MKNFWTGFEKRAALTPEQRLALEDEMHQHNISNTTLGKQVGRGAKAFGLLLGVPGGALRGALSGHEHGIGAGKGALIGAASGGLGGALFGSALGAGSHLFWKHRGKGYLKKIPDERLQAGVEAYRRHAAGDKNALNEVHKYG